MHEVGVDCDGGGGSLAGGGDDLGSGVDGVAGSPDTRDAGAAGAVDDGEAGVVEVATEAGEKVIRVWDDDGSNEDGRSWDDLSVGELDAGQAVVLDDEAGDFAVDDADTAGVEFGGLGRAGWLGVGEVDVPGAEPP